MVKPSPILVKTNGDRALIYYNYKVYSHIRLVGEISKRVRDIAGHVCRKVVCGGQFGGDTQTQGQQNSYHQEKCAPAPPQPTSAPPRYNARTYAHCVQLRHLKVTIYECY